MKHFTAPVMAVLISCATAACSTQAPTAQPGADRDEQGCIASAGYRWCSHSQQCERPWELAQAQGFENSEEGFSDYCD